MRYLITLLFAALSLNGFGQTNPNYNPDYDDDGVIGVSDILGILSTFGDTWDSGDVITPITNDNIHEAVDLWLYDECAATLTYGPISDWDVSSVTDMTDLFGLAESFNGDISSWDVYNVTNMEGMFWGAYAFSGDISSWDVSSVIYMGWMFEEADNFNINISAWDVSNVTDMRHMFYGANIFNGDISGWDVSSVWGMDHMFAEVPTFNQDLSSWDVSSATTMENMFRNADSLSEENQCAIHTSFSSNTNWPYDWSGFCPAVFNSCGDDIGHEDYDYSTVLIGDQCWFAENCRYLPIVTAYDDSYDVPIYYVYDYEATDVTAAQATSNYETYGVLYNWPAVMTEGICPSGWHIPSDGEFTQLTDFLGGENIAGEQMKSTSGWYNNGNGSNSSGFDGRPGGYAYSGGFIYNGNYGYWWSSSASGSSSAWKRALLYFDDGVDPTYNTRNYGFSARCLKD
jgi:uncharacterized protein (TIGR02145 family)